MKKYFNGQHSERKCCTKYTEKSTKSLRNINMMLKYPLAAHTSFCNPVSPLRSDSEMLQSFNFWAHSTFAVLRSDVIPCLDP